MLINRHDPLYESLRMHMDGTGESLRLNVFDGPTSVENLCHKLFTEITRMGFRLSMLEIQETDTSVVRYTREDWVGDNRNLGQKTSTPGVTADATAVGS